MSKQENEHKCPSRYITHIGQTMECERYLGHVEATDRARWHVGVYGIYWLTADEYHEPSPPPEPKWPWALIDKDGYGRSAATRSEAETLCPEGGRVMRLVDADAQVVEPRTGAERYLARRTWDPDYRQAYEDSRSTVADVLRAADIPMTGGDDDG